MVAATQNPVEHEGTYPLPEAQLDRFLFKIDIGYPNDRTRNGESFEAVHPEGLRLREPPTRPGVRLPAVTRRSPGARRPRRPLPRRHHRARRVRRRHRPGHADGAGARPGRRAPWRDGADETALAWAWLSGRGFVTPDDVKSLPSPALRAPPVAASRRRLDGVGVGSVLDSALGLGARSPADGDRPGRTVALALLRLVPVDAVAAGLPRCAGGCSSSSVPRWCSTWRWPPSPEGPSRLVPPARPTQVRLGEQTTSSPVGHQHLRAAVCAAELRDAWAPSAGAAPTPCTVLEVPPHERVQADGGHFSPTRRGDRHADRVTLRVERFAWAGRAAEVGRGPRALRALHALPGPPRAPPEPPRESCARLRRTGGRAHPGPGHRIRQPARLRPRRRRALSSTGGPPPGASTSSCAPGSPSSTTTSSSSSTPRARAPAASATPPASTPRWTPPSSSPRSPATRATASRCSPVTGRSTRGSPALDRTGPPPRHHQHARPRRVAARRGRLVRPWRPRSSGSARTVPSSSSSRRSSRPPSRRGCCRCCHRSSRTTASSSRRSPTPPSRRMRTDRSSTSRVYDAAAAERTTALRRRTASALEQPRGRRHRRLPPTCCPCGWPTTTLTLKRQGLL